MALLEDRTAVFIVRIWCERGDADSAMPEWRGSVEHVASGQRSFFRNLEAVLDFMKPHLRGIGIDAQQRFWERIATDIDATDSDALESNAVETGALQSSAIQATPPYSITARKRR